MRRGQARHSIRGGRGRGGALLQVVADDERRSLVVVSDARPHAVYFQVDVVNALSELAEPSAVARPELRARTQVCARPFAERGDRLAVALRRDAEEYAEHAQRAEVAGVAHVRVRGFRADEEGYEVRLVLARKPALVRHLVRDVEREVAVGL